VRESEDNSSSPYYFHSFSTMIDPISLSHVCGKPPSSLSPTTLKQLKKGKVSPSKILWLTVKAPPFLSVALNILAEDSEGTLISLSLYNFLPSLLLRERQKIFSVGTRFAVKEPYLRVSAAGTLILRVDNPYNVILEREWTHLVEPERLRKSPAELKAEVGFILLPSFLLPA